jgi:hypothetical protein
MSLFPITVFRRRADRFFTAAADQQGRLQIDGMPPGGYRLFAWDDVEPEACSIPSSSPPSSLAASP